MLIQLGKYDKEYRKEIENFFNQLGIEYSIRQYERTEEELEKIRKQHKEKYDKNIEQMRERQRTIRDKRKKNIPPPKPRLLEKYKQLEGQKFGNLKVIEFLECDYNYNVYYKCQCTCKNIIRVNKIDLINGKKTHCGCKK